jgi:hypothetical protein
VSNERAKAESVIDVKTDTIVKVLRFDSETGVPQYDPIARKVYVNLQDQNVFAVIDPDNDAVVARYPVDGCQGNHGMAIDAEHHRGISLVRRQRHPGGLRSRRASSHCASADGQGRRRGDV